jgi:hypothetical protein
VHWCSSPVLALAGPSLLSAVTTMGWSVGEALLVPFLMHHGISAEFASLVWIINPILGIFVNAGKHVEPWPRQKANSATPVHRLYRLWDDHGPMSQLVGFCVCI